MAVQTRYILGDAGYSSVTGYGHDAPTHVQSEAASCPQPPIQCNAVSAELSPNPNPNTMYGALVEGPIYTDTFQVFLHTLSLHYCNLRALCRACAHCIVIAEKCTPYATYGSSASHPSNLTAQLSSSDPATARTV